MATMKKEIAGRLVDIHVSEKDGTFSWRSAGSQHYVSEASLPVLAKRVQKLLAMKRISVNVPVGILHGNATPINVRLRRFSEKDHSEILVKAIDGGPHAPIRKYSDVYQLWDDASVAEFTRLKAAAREADEALDAFKKSRQLLEPKRAAKGIVSVQTVDRVLEQALDDKEALLAHKAEKAALDEARTRVDEAADRAKELDSERDLGDF
jgi:hypothetical protein